MNNSSLFHNFSLCSNLNPIKCSHLRHPATSNPTRFFFVPAKWRQAFHRTGHGCPGKYRTQSFKGIVQKSHRNQTQMRLSWSADSTWHEQHGTAPGRVVNCEVWGKLGGEVVLVCVFFCGDPPKKYVLFVLCVCAFFRKSCVNGWFWLEFWILLLMFDEVLVAFLVVKKEDPKLKKSGSTFLMGKGSHLKFVASDGHYHGWLKIPHHQ